jgi:hypothetical protein
MSDSHDYSQLAQTRTDGHNDHASQRILGQDHDQVGMSGEFAFGEFSGLWPDTRLLSGGDDGVDFRISLAFTVDVKTARKPKYLIHEQGKLFADIFVLAQYDNDTKRSELIGWEWGAKLRSSPVMDFGYGVLSHYIAAEKLRPMSELSRRMGR